MTRVKSFGSSWQLLKVYPTRPGSRQFKRRTECITWRGWRISASRPVNSLTISTTTMSQTCGPGWRAWISHKGVWTNMDLIVADSIFDEFPELILGIVIIHDTDNSQNNGAITELLRSAE